LIVIVRADGHCKSRQPSYELGSHPTGSAAIKQAQLSLYKLESHRMS